MRTDTQRRAGLGFSFVSTGIQTCGQCMTDKDGFVHNNMINRDNTDHDVLFQHL